MKSERTGAVFGLSAIGMALIFAGALTRVPLQADVRSEQPSMHHGPMLESLAKYQMLTQQYEASVDSYRRALMNNPGSSTAHMDLGTVLLLSGKGNIVAVVAEYEAAVKLDPQNLPAVNNLVWIKATNSNEKVRDGASALELAKLNLEKAESLGILRSYAAALAACGRFEEAIRVTEQALAKSTAEKDAAAVDLLNQMLVLFRERKDLRL